MKYKMVEGMKKNLGKLKYVFICFDIHSREVNTKGIQKEWKEK